MQMMAGNISEMYIKGKWFKVSALDVDGKTIAITGRWLKLAVVRSEEWLETELENPDLCIRELKRQRPNRKRADIFTCNTAQVSVSHGVGQRRRHPDHQFHCVVGEAATGDSEKRAESGEARCRGYSPRI